MAPVSTTGGARLKDEVRVDTVKPVLKDHCHERPPVLTDHKFVAERPTFQYN